MHKFLLVVGFTLAFIGGAFLINDVFLKGIVVFIVGLGVFINSLREQLKNEFFVLYAAVQEKKGDVEIVTVQYEEILKKLETLVEKYFSQEKEFLEIIKKQEAESIAIFSEKYPTFKSQIPISDLLSKVGRLREEISSAQKELNRCIREYNEYAQCSPYKKMIPSCMPKTIDYVAVS